MPRGRKENLRVPTSEQAREIGRKGGIASQKKQKEKKMLRECLEILMNEKVGKKDGKPITATEAMAAAAVKAAMKGDWEAWRLVRDTTGQKPVEKVVVADIEPSVIDEVEKMMDE